MRRPVNPKDRLRGHSQNLGTEYMLFETHRAAVAQYCKDNALDSISSADAEVLRKRWTAEALKVDVAPSWTTLTGEDVDRLKAYLTLQCDPGNEALQEKYANAADDGHRRRAIISIWRNAKTIKTIHGEKAEHADFLDWLTTEQGAEIAAKFGIDTLEKFRSWLLSDAGAEAYIVSICSDVNYSSDNWRRSLLTPLLDNLVKTLEERKRQHVAPRKRKTRSSRGLSARGRSFNLMDEMRAENSSREDGVPF